MPKREDEAAFGIRLQSLMLFSFLPPLLPYGVPCAPQLLRFFCRPSLGSEEILVQSHKSQPMWSQRTPSQVSWNVPKNFAH